MWSIRLDPTIGAEIKKVRPAVIVNDDTVGLLPLKIIVPITEWKDRYQIAPWMVKIIASKQNGLQKDSAIDAFQVRSVSEKRFVHKIGRVSEAEMLMVSSALRFVLAI
jgi:mRNA interferase MazF